MYVASKGPDFVALVIDVQQPFVLRARKNISVDVRRISTGKLEKSLKLSSGGHSSLPVDEPVVLIGHIAAR
jgi:hypothetical protein